MKTASEEPRLCEERGTRQSIRNRARARGLSYVRGVERHKAWCPQEQEKTLARAYLHWRAPQYLHCMSSSVSGGVQKEGRLTAYVAAQTSFTKVGLLGRSQQ